MRAIQAAAYELAIKQQVQHKERPYPYGGRSPQQKRKLKVVENRRRQPLSLPEIPFPVFVVSVSVITAGIIINVAQQALISQLSYQIESAKKEIQVAQQTQDNLLAQKSILESPQRIEFVAVNKLSMVKAPKVSYLKMSDDSNTDDAAGESSNSSTGASNKSITATKGKEQIQAKVTAGGRLGGKARAH